jgi:L-ascorbate metabolism protein UlaG (beta-lactamase superfamily)
MKAFCNFFFNKIACSINIHLLPFNRQPIVPLRRKKQLSMNITYLGHSSFLIEFGGKKLVFDPFISPNPAAAGINVDDIKADYVLLSHGHGDHVADAERIAKQNGATIISNYEIATYYGGKGINGHGMNHGGKYHFDFGWVKYVYATHSSVLPDGTYGGNPGGFVIWNDTDGCFYFAGDTGLTLDMQLIPMTCPKLDLAILPVGDNFTMGYDDATIAAEFIQCDTIIGCHYDTFPPVKIDHNAAKNAFAAKGKRLLLPALNQKVSM